MTAPAGPEEVREPIDAADALNYANGLTLGGLRLNNLCRAHLALHAQSASWRKVLERVTKQRNDLWTRLAKLEQESGREP